MVVGQASSDEISISYLRSGVQHAVKLYTVKFGEVEQSRAHPYEYDGTRVYNYVHEEVQAALSKMYC